MNKVGLNVIDFWLSERLFTTFALKDFINGIKAGDVDPVFIDDMDRNSKVLGDLKSRLENGCTLVMTLGLSVCWFKKATGELVHSVFPREMDDVNKPGNIGAFRRALREHEMRPTSVEQNAENLQAAIDTILGMNPKNRLIITISPIPLHFSHSETPLLTNDLISKSTLRLAVQEIEKIGMDRVHYFPSFEIVRWASPHFPSVFWGTPSTDGNPRHPDPQLVRLVIQLFVENYFQQPEKLVPSI